MDFRDAAVLSHSCRSAMGRISPFCSFPPTTGARSRRRPGPRASLIPASRHFCTSSAKASAVMAMMGMVFPSGRSISAYDWSEIEEEARAAGVSGFISKPLFKSTLFYGLKP